MESTFAIDRTQVKAKLAQKVKDDRKRQEHAEELRKNVSTWAYCSLLQNTNAFI